MRKDMHKVVTERPRAGGRIKSPKGEKRLLQKGFENCPPKREKIHQKWIYKQKIFTDVIGPLHNYLLSKVGKKWDDIYSEICHRLPKTNVQFLHIHTHIDQFVEKNVILINGVACNTKGDPIKGTSRYHKFYVDPQTNLLCKAPKEKYRQNISTPQPHWADSKHTSQYIKINNCWFLVKVRDWNKAFMPFYDQGLCRLVDINNWSDRDALRSLYGGQYVGFLKRQLGKREIRKLEAVLQPIKHGA